MQGLAKIHETAKSAMKLELGQLVKAGKGGKGTSTGGESFASGAQKKDVQLRLKTCRKDAGYSSVAQIQSRVPACPLQET